MLRGRYTQHDDAGHPHRFGPGDTIELTDSEAQAFGDAVAAAPDSGGANPTPVLPPQEESTPSPLEESDYNE